MSYDIGPKIGIDGEAAFRRSIREINASLKSMSAEMKAVASSYAAGDNSAEKLRRQEELLNRQIEAQKKKLAEASAALERSRELHGENAEVTQKWQRVVHEATAQLNEMEGSLAETTQALSQESQAAQRLAQQQERLAAQVSSTSDKLNASAQALDGVNRAALVAAAAVGGLALAAGKVGADFEAQMSKVEAISGAAGDSLEALKAKAQEMGATTKFTATQAGQALEYMAMAGWKPERMLSGLEGIMNLAAASGEDLASVSDIVTDALTAFGLKASDSAHFADVLAKASASSNTNVAMLGETFQYAAPVAGALGYAVEDVAVAVGMMANAGIKGEKAGTALRGMLTNLAKPSNQVAGYLDDLGLSLTDAAGNIKPLNQLLVEMRGKFASLTEAQKAEYAAGIAGKEAMSGLLAVVNGSDADFNNLTKAIANSNGTAKKMADTMNRNLKGQLTLLASAAESVGVAFYDKFSVQAAKAVEKLAQGVGKFGRDLASGQLDAQLKLVATGAVAAGTALVGLNAALAVKDLRNFAQAAKLGRDAVRSYQASTLAATVAQKAFNLAQSMTPWGWVALAAGAAATAFVAYQAMTKDAADGSVSLSQRIEGLNEALEDQAQAQKSLADARADSLSGVLAEVGAVEGYVAELRRITDENGRVNEGYAQRAEYLAQQINNLIPGAVEASRDEAGAIYQVAEAIDDKIFALKKEMALEAMREEYMAALEGQKEAEKNVTAALQAQGAAQEELAQAQQKYNEARNPREAERYAMGLERAQAQVRQTTEAVNTARAAADGYQRTINGFDATIAAQSLKELDKVLAGLSANIVQSTGSNQAELARAVADLQLTYDRMVAESQAAWATATEGERAQWERRIQTAKDALDQQVSEAISGGVRIGEGIAEGTETSAYRYPQEVQSLLDAGQRELEAAGVNFRRLGGEYVSEMAQAMEDNGGKPIGAASAVVAAVVDKVAAAQRQFDAIGKYMMEGLAAGIRRNAGGIGKGGPIGAAFSVASAAADAARKAADVHSPSRVFQIIGGFLSQGLALGIAAGEARVARAAGKVVSTAADTARTSAQKLSKRILSQIDSLNREIAKGQTAAQKRQSEKELAEYEKSVQEKYKALEKLELEHQEKLAKAKAGERAKLERDYLEDREKLLADLAKLEADWNEKRLKAQEQAQQAAMQSQIAALEEVRKAYDSALQDMEKKQTGMADKLKDYGELFTWVKDKAKESLELGDLQEDIDAITAYGEALARLRDGTENRRGISESLLEEILSMNMDDALAYTERLLKMTDADYEAYLSKWEEKGNLADEIARNFYRKELEALNEEFAGKIPEAMGTMKTDLYDVGIHAAQGLARGMWSERQTVIDTAVRIAQMAYSEAKKSQKIQSPSKKWAELGGYMAQGLGVGFTEEMRAVARRISDSVPVPAARNLPLERLGETMVNGMATAARSGGGYPNVRVETPVTLNGREIARVMLDDLLAVAKQRGISFG